MRINRKLLPLKAHFFFFMASMGPILPQINVYGKELGISSAVMGTVTGLIPVFFLLAKPAFGMLVDVYRDFRKTIFLLLIGLMTLAFALIIFIPPKTPRKLIFKDLAMPSLDTCNITDLDLELQCTSEAIRVNCQSSCSKKPRTFLAKTTNSNHTSYELCSFINSTFQNDTLCNLDCLEEQDSDTSCLYMSYSFWIFLLLISVGTICYNVVNSISDAICCDIIGTEFDYGKQRVWGTAGFGVTALLAGYAVDLVSDSTISYVPAFVIMLVFSVIDIISCTKLDLPVIKAPDNIFKDMRLLLKDSRVVVFIIFAILIGMVDGILIFYLLWYTEDLAIQTGTGNIKLIEGLIVGAETLGSEVIFFALSDRILERFGHVHTFSMCFISYALRLSLVSAMPSPWWLLVTEFFMQGPSYALTYASIVSYANEIAPAGASATMQGIAAGMDDGVGYALGSFLGGLSFKYFGGKHTFQLFSVLAVIFAITHLIIHKAYLDKKEKTAKSTENGKQYNTPEEALKVTYEEDE